LVWCPKCRRRVPCGGAVCCGELLEQVVAKEAVPEYEYLLVRVGPTDSPAAVVRALKGRTAGVLRQGFPYLRRLAEVLWLPSYFGASVGYVSESTVRRSIGHRWDAVPS
jgi:putative transposase